jgi:hypothetical protein
MNEAENEPSHHKKQLLVARRSDVSSDRLRVPETQQVFAFFI